MRRLLVAGLLILILVVPRLLASPESPEPTPTPSMPPQRLRPAEVARLRALHRIYDIRAKDQDAVLGVILLPDGNTYLGSYIEDREHRDFEEVGAWRGDYLTCPTAGCNAVTTDATYGLFMIYKAKYGWPPPPRTAPATPTPVAASPQPRRDHLAASAPPSVAPAASPPTASPAPPLLSVAGLLGLPFRLVRDYPFLPLVILLPISILWDSWPDLKKRSRSRRQVAAVPRREAPTLIPATERVVITHEEHERAVAQAERRLLADKAKLERLNDEIEAEEQKFITKVADITRRM